MYEWFFRGSHIDSLSCQFFNEPGIPLDFRRMSDDDPDVDSLGASFLEDLLQTLVIEGFRIDADAPLR